MLEVLVISFCLYDFECNSLTKAYLEHNKHIKQNVKIGGKKAAKIVGKEVAVTTAIAYGALGRHKLRARLPYRFVAEWNFEPNTEKNVTLNWRYDF